jgi:hypothetical protein
MKAVLKIAGDSTDRKIYRLGRGRRKQSLATTHLPSPAERSEWSEVAILRTSWCGDSLMCAVAYYDAALRTEIAVGKEVILAGVDSPRILVDGHPVLPASTWEQVCWESDDDMDYLELELKLEHGLRLFRQYMLAREDRFLFTADTFCGGREFQIEYERPLPFTRGIELQSENETCEIWCRSGRKLVTSVLPLALPEWRSESHLGRLRESRLLQHRIGRGLYCPIFIDLDSQRLGEPLTWRQLTVAEKMHIVPHDIAVAYRVQIGDNQWVIYKSVGPCASRTFLGQNHSTEFILGRFSEGAIEKLIEVETGDQPIQATADDSAGTPQASH